eukprot:12414562-Karenia_brevis.AAC.1
MRGKKTQGKGGRGQRAWDSRCWKWSHKAVQHVLDPSLPSMAHAIPQFKTLTSPRTTGTGHRAKETRA